MKIAIVGSGMAGLAAARALYEKHDITIFEQSAVVGGHALTIDAPVHGTLVPVDVGVNVFSERDYPETLKLFHELGVPLKKCSMSFAMTKADGSIEWSSLKPVRQLRSLLHPFTFASMLLEYLRFYRYVHTHEIEPDISLGEFLARHRYGKNFTHNVLLPMGCAIYTCSVDTLQRFSARTFITFFKNHGVLEVLKLPTWYNISGGCREYLKRITAPFMNRVRLSCPVSRVTRSAKTVTVESMGGSETFDAIIFACHPDEALDLLEHPTQEEKKVLGAITFSRNEVVTHTDASVMPRQKACWASWTYRLQENAGAIASEVHYYVNRLQGRDDRDPVFVTINPLRPIPAEHVIDRRTLAHPIFDVAAVAAQERLHTIQGANNTWYCGAWTSWGFHEHALTSGTSVAQSIQEKTAR